MGAKENLEEENKEGKDAVQINSGIDSTERIDAIKELIFGENMVEYDHKFHALFEKLEAYHKESEAQLMNVNEKLIIEMNEMRRKFEERVLHLQNEINAHLNKIEDDKTDRREFGKMLQVIADNLMK